MRNKKIARFMPAVLVAAVMMFILIPMGLVSAKAAPTGSGTEADPLVVDNFADLKAALESDKDAYIVVNEFANTEGKDYYELQSGIDYDQSDVMVIKISPNVEKHLEVNCTIDCREDCTGQDFALLEYFVYNKGTLFISGDGTIAANLHGDDYGKLILIRNNTGKLVVDGNVTISAISSEGEKQISDYATPILSFEGILDIKNGTFVGCMDAPTGSINAVASVYDATLTISGGNFKCVTSNVNTSKCSINIHFPFVASINGGTFDGIAVTGKNISLKDLLDEGCLYAYSVNNNGQIVQGIDNRDGGTQIEGTVRVGIPVTAADITITEPVVGAAPVFTGSAGTGDAGYKVSVEWLIGNDKTKKLSATDKFEGRDYVALVKLTAEDGYILDEASLKQNLKLNGVAKTNFNCGYAGAGGSLVVPFQLRYSEVSVTITEPVAGQSPDYTAVETDAGYSAKITQWTEYQDDTQTDKVMSATDKFAEGKEYSAIIEISANEGYAFDVTKCTINGAEVALYDSNTANVLYYKVNFVIDKIISGTCSCSITIPKAGANPDYTAVDIDNHSEYNVEIVSWYRDNNENDVLSTNDTFEAGETYSAKVKITTNKNIVFDDSDFHLSVSGADATTLISMDSNEIYYKVTYYGLKSIKNISLQITEPVIGEEPDFTVTTNDVGYTALLL